MQWKHRRWLGCAGVSALCWVAAGLPPAQAAGRTYDSALFLRIAPVPGQTISQVFSRTISTRVEGFDPSVGRVSGTGTYRYASASGDQLSFDSQFLYDGRPASSGTTKIRRDGSESCWMDQCGPATDASGLLYNVLIWGTPPPQIRVGTRWQAKILKPWELGPAGEEEVTVLALNPATGSITLMREGRGEGPFDGDPPQLKLSADGKATSFDLKSGKAHWSGFTTFEKGVVVSDELLVERSMSLTSSAAGSRQGLQRQYILLNEMPQGSWEKG